MSTEWTTKSKKRLQVIRDVMALVVGAVLLVGELLLPGKAESSLVFAGLSLMGFGAYLRTKA